MVTDFKTSDKGSDLFDTLFAHFRKTINLARIKSLTKILKAIVILRTVNFAKLATALGRQACMLGHKVRYFSTLKLFEHIALASATASVHRCFDQLAATNLIILDDFGLQRLDSQQMLDFMELVKDRHGRKSTVIVSQVPVSDWYEILSANTTAADAILDRLVHSANRITLKGGSLRK